MGAGSVIDLSGQEEDFPSLNELWCCAEQKVGYAAFWSDSTF